MARKGEITLYEGVGKASKKPFTALKLTVGTWSKLYFVDSQFEMDYIKKYLSENPSVEEATKGKSILDDVDVEL